MTLWKKITVIGVLVSVTVLLSTIHIVSQHGKKQPEYSILQALAAIGSNDVESIHRYIDIDSVINHSLESGREVAMQIMRGPVESRSVWEKLLTTYFENIESKLVEYARDDLLTYLNESSKTLSGSRGLRWTIYTKILDRNRRIESKSVYVELEDEWTPDGFPKGLELELIDMGEYWRIVQISNLASKLQKYVKSNERQFVSRTQAFDEMLRSMGQTGAWIAKDWSASPENSVLQAAFAIMDRDFSKFERHVDLDRIGGATVDIMVEAELKKRKPANEPLSAMADELALLAIKSMKPEFVRAFRADLRNFFEGADLSSSKPPPQPISGLWDAEFQLFSDRSFEEISIVRYGSIAIVTIKTGSDDEKLKNITVTMTERDGYWQATEITGLKQMLGR